MKPPIPTYIAAYPEPKETNYFIIIPIIVIIIAIIYYFYFYTNKIDEGKTY